FGQGIRSPQFSPSLLIVLYLLSNLIASFIPASYFIKVPFFYVVLFFDTFMVSLGIYITSQFQTDFYLVYVLIIIFASLSRSFRLLVLNGLVICGIYGWLLWQKGLTILSLDEGVLLRIPFIFIMNLFYGILVQSYETRTKRIKTELKEVEESEERYRQIVEGTHDSVAILDEKNQIRFFNRRFVDLTHYSPEELIGMDLITVMGGFAAEGIKKDLLQKLDLKQPLIHETEVVQKGGGKRKVEISASRFFLPTGKTYSILYLKDTTEKHQMEERLIQSEKLRALGELASGIAHDFNNALAVILGYTQVLLSKAKEEKSIEALKTIERVTKDAAQTVRRLQNFAGRRSQEVFQVDINATIKDAVEITKPKWKDEAQRKGISNEMVLNLEEIPFAGCVASELREVITNMIFNAVDAMPEGGRIEIRTFRNKSKVSIQIKDTGAGIPEEVKEKVFEPFFTTKPFGNAGLGLSVSYGIIKRFQGEIDFESQAGRGTTFTISLPEGTGKKEEVDAFPATREGRKGRILVIDDEAPVRDVLRTILSEANHRVTVAGNGEEGLRLFKEDHFDVVLTDLGMP
ncbi:MAG: PAS domain S-box protein, partial [Deltaproteobacteria bacterium]